MLLTTSVSKTIYSTQHNVGVLRFVDAGTKAVELENGAALNEPTTYAVRVAIEQAVFDMIIEGEKKGIWRFKTPMRQHPAVSESPASQEFPLKTEDKKDDWVRFPPLDKQGETPAAEKKNTDTLVGKKAVMKDTHYVRREPNETSTRVWLFTKNTAIQVEEEQGEWIKIIAEDGKKGYVKRESIQLEVKK